MNQIAQIMQTAIYTGFGAVVLWTYFGLFLPGRTDGIWRILCWVPFLAWQFIWGILAAAGRPTPILVNTAISLVVTSIAAVIGYAGSLKKKLIFAFSYIVLGMISEETVWYGVQFFCAPNTNMTAWWPPILAKVLSLAAILVLYFLLRKKNFAETDERANRYLLIFTGGNMFVAYSVTLAYDRLGSESDNLIAVFTILILLLMTIFVYLIYGKIWESIELKKQNEKYEYQIEIFRQHQNEREENEQELRRFRHDQKQKLAYLKELAEVSKSKEIVRFLQEEVNEDLKSVCSLINTGNMVIDAILNDKYKKAAASGVKFETNLNIPPELPYRDSDLCVILGNLLDNAFEASMSISQEMRYIKTTILSHKNNLIISVENNYAGKLSRGWDGQLVSSKKDARNHGFGLKSVRKTAEKYGGDVYFENTENMFKVTVALYE